MRKHILLILVLFLGLFASNSAFSQDTTVVLSSDMFDAEQVIFMGSLEGWAYRPGHDPAWADPDLDTSGWEALRPSDLTIGHTGESGLFEGWFRLRFTIDSTFTGIPLGWRSGTLGAMELFLDGERVQSFGSPDPDPGQHESYNPYNQIPGPAELEVGREYLLAFYLVDHHSALITRYSLKEARLDPWLRLTGPEYTEFIRSITNALINFQVLWITALFLLTFLFWVISFQSGREYLLRLIAWMNTLFLISALANHAQFTLAANLIQMELAQLIFTLSFYMLIALVPMVVSQILKGEISRRLKMLFWIYLLMGILAYQTDQIALPILGLLIITGICLAFIRTSWGRIRTSQWMVIGGLILTTCWMLVYLFYELVFASNLNVQNILVTAIYLTLPISLLLFISVRYKETLLEIQKSAREVVQLTSEKLEAEKEKQAIAANQKKILEQEVERRTQELRESLENLRATQEQLVQQEKLASLGQLTAGIAHEIKNPLNFVNNFSDVSLEMIDEALEELKKIGENDQAEEHAAEHASGHDTKNAAKDASEHASGHDTNNAVKDAAEHASGHDTNNAAKDAAKHIAETAAILADIKSNLQKIHEHGTRADGIVKSMLQHSRGGSGKMEPTDLNALVKEYVNLAFHGMRAGKDPINVAIDLQLDENVGEVALIAENFSRVILNLCNNGFDAMREKLRVESLKFKVGSEKLKVESLKLKVGSEKLKVGSEKLKVESLKFKVYSPKLSVRTHQTESNITLEIEDNGPGIPEEIRDKILQPFFTTKKGTAGTGLGLSIAHDIVKAHGGEMEINSAKGEGAKFIITLKKN